MSEVATEIFKRPPVEEMGMGVVFHPLVKLSGPFYGLFWQQIRDAYPELGAQPARPAILDGESDAMSPHAVIFAATELPQRYMFSDSTQQNAVALQRDVLARTWTRRRAGEVYPTYHSSLREQFVKTWDRFRQFTHDNSIGDLRVRQCEVSYTNLIPRSEGWESFKDMPEVLRPWCGCTESPLAAPDRITIQAAYPIVEAKGHVLMTVTPSRRIWDSADCLAITFTSQVRVDDEDPAKIPSFIDLAHKWAGRVFGAVMAKEVRKFWR